MDWISVKDRLPDDTQEKLVSMVEISSGDQYFDITTMNPALTGFYVDYIDNDNPRYYVTHWMPIHAPEDVK